MRTFTVFLSLLTLASACKTASVESSPVTAAADTRNESPELASAEPEPAPPIPDEPGPAEVLAARDGVAPEYDSPLNELDAVYFEFDSAELSDESREILDRVAQWLVTHPEVTVHIEGHTDSRGTSEYNLALGDRRACAIRDYLALLGVREAQMSTVSYGEELPATLGDDDAAHARNRRGEILGEQAPVMGALE